MLMKPQIGEVNMAYAPANVKVLGCFREDEYGKTFEYSSNPEYILSPKAHGGKNTQFPHLLHVGPEGKDTRYALILKGIAHVIVDETDNGWVVEKWIIKSHRKYA